MFLRPEPITPAFAAAQAYLQQFIDYEKKMPALYGPDKMDPTRPGRLLAALGSPHERLKAIHIAGTKGKGSVAAYCAAALRAAGLKVGLYTSPHLIDFRERIRILTPADEDGRISQAAFVALVDQLRPVIPTIPGLTWFELVTALAFMHFAQEKVDIAVVEVGLGGRLDATNALTPLVAVITSISYDHTALLGETLAAIAGEKGGIIKPGVPVVIAPQPPEALRRLRDIAASRDAPTTLVGQDVTLATRALDPTLSQVAVYDQRAPNPAATERLLTLSLPGYHQQVNAAVALAALDQVQPHFPTLTTAAVQAGFAHTQWPGRLQRLPASSEEGPDILLDGAHNGDSAAKLAQALRDLFPDRRCRFLLGVTRDKDFAGILRALLPLSTNIVVTRSTHPRAADPTHLQQVAATLGGSIQISPNLVHGLRTLWQQSSPADLICVTGSLYIVGDLLNQWERLQSDLSRPTH